MWGRRFDPRVYLSLLPVVGGIVLTSVTELSFVWAGFLAALFGCFVTSTKVCSRHPHALCARATLCQSYPDKPCALIGVQSQSLEGIA